MSNKLKCIYNAAFTDEISILMNGILIYFQLNSLIFFRRLVKAKGYKYLIEAISLLKDQYPIKLYLAGSGEEEINLKNQVKKLRMEDHIIFLGQQNNPYKFMKNCDLYVHPSLWDGLPTTVIEAMACGCCVISTDCDSGPREIIDHLENGILVSPIKSPNKIERND